MRVRRLLSVVGLAGSVALCGFAALPAAATEDHDVHGSAYALSVDAKVLGNTLPVKIGPMPVAKYPPGSEKSVVRIDGVSQPPLLKSGILNASSLFQNGKLTSVGSIADLEVAGLVKAKVIEAKCVLDEKGARGETTLVDVEIAGVKIQAKPGGPQDYQLLDGAVSVVVNEQVRDGDKLKVNALHVKVTKGLKDVLFLDAIFGNAVCAGRVDGGEPPTSTTVPPTTPTQPTTTSPAPPTTPTSGPTNPPTTTSGAGSLPNPGDGSGKPPASEADHKRLANTGVGTWLPWAIGIAVVLLGGGGYALYWVRKRGQAKT